MRENVPNLPLSVLWHEGMLLSPQHFQMNDKYVTKLVNFRSFAVNQLGWGIVDFSIDEIALTSGSLVLKACKAIFPDGTCFDLGADSGLELSLNLNDYLQAFETGPVKFDLQLPSETAPGLKTETKQFVRSEVIDIVDDNLEDRSVSVTVKRPNVRLVMSDKVSRRYSEISILEIALIDGIFQITDFHPPSIALIEGSKLSTYLKDMCIKLREKCLIVSEQGKSAVNSGNLERQQLLAHRFNMLCQALPSIECLCSDERAHPHDVFNALTALCGSISGLNNFIAPPSGALYSHLDITKAFMPFLNFADKTLNKITNVYHLIEFENLEGSFELDLKIAEENSWIYLVLERSAGISAAETWVWLQDCLIADVQIVEELKKRRTLGVARKLLQGQEVIEFEVGERVVIAGLKLETDLLGAGGRLGIRNPNPSSPSMPKTISLYNFGIN